jgi:hypothetical protein
MPELLQRLAALGSRHVHRRKSIAPMPGPAGVDHGEAVGVVAGGLALGLDARIERRRPGAAPPSGVAIGSGIETCSFITHTRFCRVLFRRSAKCLYC